MPPHLASEQYWAFISYSSKDARIARKLQRWLERYRVPRDLVGQQGPGGPIPERLFPIFRDRDELPLGSNLNQSIEQALSASRTLIVLCSPAAVASRWVNEEIRYFKHLGRADRILTIVLEDDPFPPDGQPFAACFPPALRDGLHGEGGPEPIAGDLRQGGDGWTATCLKTVAGITGLGLEALVRREKARMRIRRIAAGVAASLLLGVTLWVADYNRPKIGHFADTETRWGVPHGVGALSDEVVRGREIHYRIESRRNKVRRVWRLNAAGQLSHRAGNDPAVQEIFYRENGTVQQIDVRDHNGRLVLRKSFGERRETIDGPAQYVDFHLEERDEPFAMPADTGVLGPGGARDSVSQMTAQQLLYDDAGRTVQVLFFNAYRQNRSNSAGVFGRRFSYDGASLRLTSIENLGADGNPAQERFGVVKMDLVSDLRGDVLEERFFGIQGQPVLSDDRCHQESVKLDVYGNVIEWICLGRTRAPIVSRDGYHKIAQTYDGRGNLIAMAYFDVDGRPMLNDNGAHRVTQSFDPRGHLIAWSHYGIEGNPVLDRDGCHNVRQVVDSRGNVTESRCFGEHGEPVMNADGVHRTQWRLDDRGDVDEEAFFDKDGKPTTDQDGVHKIEWWLPDARGNATVSLYKGVDGRRTVDAGGVYKIMRTFDLFGNLVEEAFFGIDDKPVPDGVHLSIRTFDTAGNLIGTAFFDKERKPIAVPAGFHSYRDSFDANTSRGERSFFGIDGAPTVDGEGVHKRTQHVDFDGNLVEELCFGTDGKAVADRRGIHRRTWRHDRYGNVIEQASFDTRGRPVADDEQVHKLTWRHDARGNTIEEARFGVDGRPVVVDGIHETTWRFDPRDRVIERAFFGRDGAPVLHPAGFHAVRSRHDGRGHVTESTHFGVDGNPVLDRDGVHRTTYVHDERGRLVEFAHFGIDGKPKGDRKGLSKLRVTLDSRGDVTSAHRYVINVRTERSPRELDR